MIAPDTSVWVAANRNPAGPVAVTLRALIDADEICVPLPVRIELLSGLDRQQRPALRRALSALPVVVPTDDTWLVVERWVEQAADAGQRFTVTDLLIAALAHELTALVWSQDRDFDRMTSLGFVQSYQ